MFILHSCLAKFVRSDVADRLLGVDNWRYDALSCLVLIEAKRQDDEEFLASCTPEVVGQAITGSSLQGSYLGLTPTFNSQSQVHFYLSNGRSWIVCILEEASGWVYFDSENVSADPFLEEVWHRLSPVEQHSSILQLRALKSQHPECVQAVDGSGLIVSRLDSGVWSPWLD